MKYITLTKVIILFLFLIANRFSTPLYAQSDSLYGVVVETYTQRPIPFTAIFINDSSVIFSNTQGGFYIPKNITIRKINFTHPLHRSKTIENVINDSLLIRVELSKFELFCFEKASSKSSHKLLSKAIRHRFDNNFENKSYFSYMSYNKYIFRSDETDAANAILQKGFTSISRKKIDTLFDGQHFILVESATERKYINHLHQRETIWGAQSSNVNITSIFIRTAEFMNPNIYHEYVRWNGKNYISPLSIIAQRKYVYTLVDTITDNKDTIWVVKFNPHIHKNFEALKGYLYIHSKSYALLHFEISPAYERKITQTYYQSFSQTESGTWFPSNSRYLVENIILGPKVRGMMIADNVNYDIKLSDVMSKKHFDETVLEYSDEALQKEEEFWSRHRQIPFTVYDSLTYAYFQNNDRNKSLEKILQTAENFVYGYIPLSIINFQTHKIINLNYIEGLRLGIGGYTNERLSKKFSVGAYVGYGFKDKHIKGGANGSYLIYEPYKVYANLAFYSDITEPGAQVFSFDKFQFSSEVLRKYRLSVMDYQSKVDMNVTAHPIKYLDVKAGFSISENIPAYTYVYKAQSRESYRFAEFEAGFRYAYGQQQIKTPTYNLFEIDYYPVFSLHLMQGISAMGGEFSYSRIDAKIEKKTRVPGLGITTVQLAGAYIGGDAPYMKLFNGKGSRRSLSVLVHNSFESMGYNQYLADRYVALFISHNFGRLFYKHRNFRPDLTVIHNMGIGGLKHPNWHQGDPIRKSLADGYVESGLFINRIIVLPLGGLKAGLGAGAVVHYGPGATDNLKDNVNLKISIEFGL